MVRLKRVSQLAHLVSKDTSSDLPVADDLADFYRQQAQSAIAAEAEKRIAENNDPAEIERLLSLSLIEIIESDSDDIIPALMARLGPVRAALEGHGGGLVLSSWELVELSKGDRGLSLVIDLDGACVSCGAAPGTLKGIQDDLLLDDEVSQVRFAASMLEWFNEIQREFVLVHGGVTFV